MPNYEFQCKNKKCSNYFEEVCTISDFDADFPEVRCPKCKSKKIKRLLSGCPVFLNSPDKMNNFEYAAEKNFEKAQIESSTAKELARKKGITSPYNDLPDFTDNGRRMNFID